MFALLMSAIWTTVAWVLRVIVIKAVLYIALFTFVSEAVGYLLSKVSVQTAGIGSAFAQLSPGMIYFLTVFKLDVGLPMVAAAMLTRFTIRRLPIIG